MRRQSGGGPGAYHRLGAAPIKFSFYARLCSIRTNLEFDLRVQRCTNLETMPIEDASVQWPEEQSPYRTVARLSLPPQDALSEEHYRYFEQRISFNPIHALEAHRPLGGVQRARMQAYLHTQDFRQRTNEVNPAEPGSHAEVPD